MRWKKNYKLNGGKIHMKNFLIRVAIMLFICACLLIACVCVSADEGSAQFIDEMGESL